MANDYPWYAEVKDANLSQGDMFTSCPVLEPSAQFISAQAIPVADLVADRRSVDVVVLSQSCDLANDKLESVVLCPYWSLDEFEAQQPSFRSPKMKEQLRRGNIPGFHLLAAPTVPGFELGLRVVAFRAVYSLPLVFLKQLAATQGRRLRLLPPYREHLAQAFARFFMRVGLPTDIPPFTA